MRINVYAEEMTSDVEVVHKVIAATGNEYFGLRVFLKSPAELHDGYEDDDRTAITFWSDSPDTLVRLLKIGISALVDQW